METNEWLPWLKTITAYSIVGSFTFGLGYALYVSGAYVVVIAIAAIATGVVALGWAMNKVAQDIYNRWGKND
jgi:thiol:disulfide interchange protein